MTTEEARTNMIKQQIHTWGVVDFDILDLIKNTPRELFVPATFKELAFADINIPLSNGQVMLTPKEEARILQELHIQPHERILEIGTGSGYFTALLAKKALSVTSIDIFSEFTEQATNSLSALNIKNVELITTDASRGYLKGAPFDVIVMTSAVAFLPDAFRNSIKSGGRIFTIMGQVPAMEAILLTRKENNEWQTDVLFETVVPPLIHAKQPSQFVF